MKVAALAVIGLMVACVFIDQQRNERIEIERQSRIEAATKDMMSFGERIGVEVKYNCVLSSNNPVGDLFFSRSSFWISCEYEPSSMSDIQIQEALKVLGSPDCIIGKIEDMLEGWGRPNVSVTSLRAFEEQCRAKENLDRKLEMLDGLKDNKEAVEQPLYERVMI